MAGDVGMRRVGFITAKTVKPGGKPSGPSRGFSARKDRRVSAPALIVAMLDELVREGVACITHELLARRSGLKCSTVRDALCEIRKDGWRWPEVKPAAVEKDSEEGLTDEVIRERAEAEQKKSLLESRDASKGFAPGVVVAKDAVEKNRFYVLREVLADAERRGLIRGTRYRRAWDRLASKGAGEAAGDGCNAGDATTGLGRAAG